MVNPNTESEQQDTEKKQQYISKKVFLILTKRREVRKLNDEIDDLIMDVVLYGDKE